MQRAVTSKTTFYERYQQILIKIRVSNVQPLPFLICTGQSSALENEETCDSVFPSVCIYVAFCTPYQFPNTWIYPAFRGEVRSMYFDSDHVNGLEQVLCSSCQTVLRTMCVCKGSTHNLRYSNESGQQIYYGYWLQILPIFDPNALTIKTHSNGMETLTLRFPKHPEFNLVHIESYIIQSITLIIVGLI